MNKIEKNGFEIEFSKEFENVCKLYYNKQNNEELSKEEIVNYFINVYESALKKGYAEVE